MLTTGEPRFSREMIEEALNWERRMIAKDHAEGELTLEEVRSLASPEAQEHVASLEGLLGEAKGRPRDAHERVLTAFASLGHDAGPARHGGMTEIPRFGRVQPNRGRGLGPRVCGCFSAIRWVVKCIRISFVCA